MSTLTVQETRSALTYKTILHVERERALEHLRVTVALTRAELGLPHVEVTP